MLLKITRTLLSLCLLFAMLYLGKGLSILLPIGIPDSDWYCESRVGNAGCQTINTLYDDFLYSNLCRNCRTRRYSQKPLRLFCFSQYA